MSKPEFINNHKLINIITRKEAEDILRKVWDIARDYESVLVTDVKDLVGIDSDYLDNGWMWTIPEIKAAQIFHDSGYYEIVFPFPTFHDPSVKKKKVINKSALTYQTEKPSTDYIDPIHITIHTNSVDDPAGVTEEVFRYANTIKDRTVKIDIR